MFFLCLIDIYIKYICKRISLISQLTNNILKFFFMLESLKVKLKEFIVTFNNKLVELGRERVIIALIIGLFTSLISSICFEITLIATFLFAVIGFLIINDENSMFTDFDKTTYKLSLFLCILSLLMSLL